MYRQSNYFDSVGENHHYEWQTPLHNFWCLIATIAVLSVVFALFYFRNSSDPDVFDLSASAQNPNLSAFEFHIDFGKKREFDRKADYGKTSTLDNDTLYGDANFDGFILFATCDIDTTEYVKQLRQETAISFSPEIDSEIRNLSGNPKKEAQYGLYPFQEVYFKTNIESPYFSSFLNTIPRITQTPKHPHKNSYFYYRGPYRAEYEHYFKNSILYSEHKFELFKAVEQTTQLDTVDTIWEKLDERRLPRNYVVKKKNSYGFYSPNSRFNYFNEMYIGGVNKGWNPFINSSVCQFIIKPIKFPEAKTNRLVLSFNAPMQFDIISIPPDSITDTQMFFYTPEKIKRLSTEELYVYSRSIASMNYQETWNFIYASLIGIIISFCIEFGKRLYNYRRQRLYKARAKLRTCEKLFLGLMFWWTYDKCKHFISSKKWKFNLKSDTDHETGN